MRFRSIVLVVLGVVFSALTLVFGQTWLNTQADLRARQIAAQMGSPEQPAPVAGKTVVVAATALRFGTELAPVMLREVTWPGDAVPAGSFAKVSDILDGKTRRVALAAIEPGEAVIKSKVTGPGERATLSAMVADGMRAVTIRVNDVLGVGGFVLPGDRVDVMLTREARKEDSQVALSDVVLQNVKVLAVDQTADEKAEKPTVVKAVTVEVNTVGAQKISVAQTVGTLSLILRPAGEVNPETTRRITVSDLGEPTFMDVAKKPEDPNLVDKFQSALDQRMRGVEERIDRVGDELRRRQQPATAARAEVVPSKPTMATVGVLRGLKRNEYTVPQN
ncbi:Flp pilus assembly protein CpaB [Prosthecomicrobium sp. N25]|uniref:Flp pilus assembly protein CpaB n=1 Tax=Prosthecomicrobium sp. N25 TaxID=3129254 RepID=UPI003077259B